MDQLYYAPGAASMLVHWLLLELDAPHELHLVDTASRRAEAPEYLALNPNGVVPTLVHRRRADVRGRRAGDDARRSPSAGGARASAGDRCVADYTQWMFHLANAVQPLFRQWWYPHEPPAKPMPSGARARRAADRGARGTAHRRAPRRHGPYLLGDTLSVADFYLTMLMRWSRNMPRPATQWPHLAALAQR